jgi:osmotically-inducible protein OsmY
MTPMNPRRAPHSSVAVAQQDERLAVEVTRRLAWDSWVPKDIVRVKVEQGWVTLQGELERDRQKVAVMEDVSRLFGVAGVLDRTTVRS